MLPLPCSPPALPATEPSSTIGNATIPGLKNSPVITTMREAESFSMLPRMQTLWHSMFYTEEKKLDIRADWDSDKGIWATYIPYPGAQPLIVNYLRDDADVDPGDYSKCMKKKGYTIRAYEIPEITNIRMHGHPSY